MVLDFAGDYIAMGEDIEEKQQYLNSAVSAWNIACLDEKSQKRSIQKYMAEIEDWIQRKAHEIFVMSMAGVNRTGQSEISARLADRRMIQKDQISSSL